MSEIQQPLNLSQRQTLLFMALSVVHDFCTANQINYSLAYGTLLGAVRHKDFIPWDDDADIFMPRHDYEKLVTTFKHPDYYISSYQTDTSCESRYAFLCDKRISYIHHNSLRFPALDIFPVDNVPINIDKKKFAEKIYLLSNNIVCTRHAYKNAYNILRGFASFTYYKFKYPHTRKFAISQFENLLTESRNQPVQCLLDFSNYYIGPDKFFFPTDLFDNYCDIDFHGKTFRCIKSYDKFLTLRYGDYMTLPPIEQRVGGHIGNVYVKKEYSIII